MVPDIRKWPEGSRSNGDVEGNCANCNYLFGSASWEKMLSVTKCNLSMLSGNVLKCIIVRLKSNRSGNVFDLLYNKRTSRMSPNWNTLLLFLAFTPFNVKHNDHSGTGLCLGISCAYNNVYGLHKSAAHFCSCCSSTPSGINIEEILSVISMSLYIVSDILTSKINQ